MSDEQDVWSALKALLVTSPLGDDVYDYGEVPGVDGNPGQTPEAYTLLSIERRHVPTNNGRTSVTGWRSSIRYVATTAEDARLVGGWVRAAFEISPGRGRRLSVSGATSTPITHESTIAVTPDGDRYSGLSQWTLAL